MADNFSRYSKPKAGEPPAQGGDPPDRMPTNEELLYELRKHGVKPGPSRPSPAVSRRTRDYLLTAGLSSGAIMFACFRLLTDSEPATILRLALTGIVVICGLLWFIFYGIMNRY